MFRHGHYFDGGKKFDFPRLYDHPSGLTGSELSCFTYARCMAAKGHDVSILTTLSDNRCERWEGVRIIPMDKREDIGTLGGDWDVVYSWNDIDALKFATSPNTLKVLNLQINDVDHGEPGFDRFVDVYTSPSHSHRSVMSKKTPDPSKWEVVPNGCDSSVYAEWILPVPGRVIYASSPDRGLHWLLKAWPKIAAAVPHAHLKIFYELQRWVNDLVDAPPINRDIEVLSTRARYIRESLRRLKDHRIELVGSVSRNAIARQFMEAEVLAYPCDTINYTEGFSVTLMEACASRTVPVTTDIDALGEIYGWHVPIVASPVGDRLDEFADLVIRALQDEDYRSGVLKKTADLAARYDWHALTRQLIYMLQRRGAP